MKILLTGSRNFVATNIARKLYKQGNDIFTADSVDFDYVRHSRFVKESFKVPSARFDEANYIKNIINIVNSRKINKIIPLGEEVFYLSKNYNLFINNCPKTTIHCGNFEQLETLHNKYMFGKLAYSINLPVPFFKLAKSAYDITEFKKSINKRIILKPVYSRFGKEFYDINDLEFDKIDWNLDYIAQEYIDGEIISSFSYNDSAEVITYKCDYTTNRPGAMASARRIITSDEIKQIDYKIRQNLGYKAQLGLDYIKASNGKLYLIEANPRATFGLALADNKKIQSRLLMFHYLLGGNIEAKCLAKFFWVFITYPDLLFSFKDFKPALASQLGGLKEYIKFRRSHPGMGTRDYASYDMEYNGPGIDYKAIEADLDDSSQILELLETIPTKGKIGLVYTRRPNAYKSFHSDGEHVSIGLIKDRQNNIAIMGTCVENNYYIDGKIYKAGYIGSFRKRPNTQYIHNWIEAIVTKYQNSDANIYFCSILSNNKHAIDVFTKNRSNIPKLKLVAKYTIFVVNPRKAKRNIVKNQAVFEKAKTKDELKIIEFINNEGKQYDFFPVIHNLNNNKMNVTCDNSFVLKINDEIVGFASINNQNYKKQFIIKNYSRPIKFLALFNPISEMLGLMKIPEINIPIICPAVTLCVTKNNNKQLFQTLISELSKAISKDYSLFMIALPIDSPNYATLNNWHNFKINNNLYTINFSKKVYKIDNPYTEVSVIL